MTFNISIEKMKKIITSLLLIITNISYSQNPNPLYFFPHHKGDIFEYTDKSESGYWQNIIIKDSLGEDGKFYIDTRYKGDYPISTYFGEWKIDTNKYEVYQGYQNTYPQFKLNANRGETWIVYIDSVNKRFVQAEVIDVFPANILGEDVSIKDIDYVGYEIINSDTLRGLDYRFYYLASKFGIIAEYGNPPAQPIYYLRGAKIDGKIYGTITTINEYLKVFPKDFTLFQNYPNPFNSQTQITFQIPQLEFVSLKVYDILGKEIATVINEERQVGKYQINFDASEFNLTSGIYIYLLKAGKYIQSKKMIYLK